jgi:hypothetical protein
MHVSFVDAIASGPRGYMIDLLPMNFENRQSAGRAWFHSMLHSS